MSSNKNYRVKSDIFKIANRVYNGLSPACGKQVYMDALEAEFSAAGYFHAERNPSLPVFYRGKTLGHTTCADFRVFDRALIFVFVTGKIRAPERSAVYKRAVATGYDMVFILNFGKNDPEFFRVYINEKGFNNGTAV
ncbi:hypothetical protein FACS1894190_16610 [Spirochaetia bacterium]|nr:hypothetical protein FACS1894190_16610 [Spirochaetia bacterium]